MLTPLLKILVLSFTGSPRPLSLLQVCRTVQNWLLPLLYHSVTFNTSSQLSTFLSIHDIPNNLLQERFRLIRNMYIGRTPSSPGDLTYGSANWPLLVVDRILWLSTSLESLTLLFLDQNHWQRFEHAIPASLRYLALGPVHGSFRPQDLRQQPKLETFVSVFSFMRDDEVKDVACFPSLRRFSRLFESLPVFPPDGGHSFEAEYISQLTSTNLEKHEIVFCGCKVSKSARQAKEVTDDPRVVVMQDTRTWLVWLYDEYLLERQRFIDLQLLS